MCEMKLDSIENIIETLKDLSETILVEKDINIKQKLMWDFADTVLNVPPSIVSEEVDNVMRELGIDLNFIDAADGDLINEKLKKEIGDIINKLRSIK